MALNLRSFDDNTSDWWGHLPSSITGYDFEVVVARPLVAISRRDFLRAGPYSFLMSRVIRLVIPRLRKDKWYSQGQRSCNWDE